MNTTEDELKNRYPALEENGIQLTLMYLDLVAQAIKLELISVEEVMLMDSKDVDHEYDVTCLVHKIADVLSVLKDPVTAIQIPKEKEAFEQWVQHSAQYPKVICYDALVDVFMSASAFLSKNQE